MIEDIIIYCVVVLAIFFLVKPFLSKKNKGCDGVSCKCSKDDISDKK